MSSRRIEFFLFFSNYIEFEKFLLSRMFVEPVSLVLLLLNLLAKNARAQFSFEFMQLPITDTVKFNHEYDFIVIGAGSG